MVSRSATASGVISTGTNSRSHSKLTRIVYRPNSFHSPVGEGLGRGGQSRGLSDVLPRPSRKARRATCFPKEVIRLNPRGEVAHREVPTLCCQAPPDGAQRAGEREMCDTQRSRTVGGIADRFRRRDGCHRSRTSASPGARLPFQRQNPYRPLDRNRRSCRGQD